MHVFKVSSKVSALGKCLVTVRTFERSLSCVLPEVVSQITRLLEDTAASFVHAFEVQLDPLGLRISDLNGLVP